MSKTWRMAATLAAGLLLAAAATSQTVWAAALPATGAPAGGALQQKSDQNTLTYAWVVTANVPVFANPGDPAPVRDLGAGFLYVSLADARPVTVGDQAWYQINPGEYVNAANLQLIKPTSFHGITLTGTPDQPFGWLVYAAQPAAEAGGVAAKGTPLLPRYTPITAFEEKQVGDLIWYRIGDQQWVDQKKVGLIFPAARPAGVGAGDKWIDVNTFEQTLAAYEGDRMVYATLVSSGLPYWATDPGLFRVYAKVKIAKMSGRDGLPDYYFLEDVPYAMYFNRDMALHGAYWHDKFGFKHSHGCVNLPPQDAEWLYNWTTPAASASNWTVVPDRANNTIGTWVWVHEG